MTVQLNFAPVPQTESRRLCRHARISGLFTDTSEHMRFLLFSFSIFHCFTFWFRVVDKLTYMYVSF